MKIYKKILFILIPLAIVAVLLIAFTAIKLTMGNSTDIKYSDTPIQGQIASHQEVSVYTANLYNDTPTETEHGALGDWQNSKNIKQGDYVPRVIESTATDTSTNIQNIINTSEQITVSTDTNNSTPYTQETPEDSGIWGWVPQTIVRASKESVEVPQNIQDLKIFGNKYGNRIKKLTREAGDQSKILANFMADYDGQGTYLALFELGTQYTELSKDLALLYTPGELGSTPDKLSQSYQLISAELLKLSAVENDTDALKQIYAYNASVDTFAKEYIKLVNLFGAYGIIFTKGEGGDIFTPPSRGGGTL